MKIVICDDVLQDAEIAKSVIEDTLSNTGIEIDIESPKNVQVAVEENIFKCDIMIMDIQFKDENFDGIQLSTLINKMLPACQIIYLTNILEFAPMVYETMHCYFVMKDNMKIMLPRAVKKAINEYNEATSNEVAELLCDGHKVYIVHKDIIYIERDDRVLKIHTQNKEYTCYLSLRQIEKKLSSSFVRCHGGFVVNLDYVTSIEKDNLYLKTGINLPIGKRFYDDFKLSYLNYYANKV